MTEVFSVVQVPTARLLLIVLIMLLAVQLTGLSCLDEWRIGSPLGFSVVLTQLSNGTTGVDQRGDDGCPCHLQIAPVYRAPLQVGCPVQPVGSEVPITFLPTLASWLFHPPISL